jgi:hypothetical protein
MRPTRLAPRSGIVKLMNRFAILQPQVHHIIADRDLSEMANPDCPIRHRPHDVTHRPVLRHAPEADSARSTIVVRHIATVLARTS